MRAVEHVIAVGSRALYAKAAGKIESRLKKSSAVLLAVRVRCLRYYHYDN